jgi:chromosome segregation ATPase
MNSSEIIQRIKLREKEIHDLDTQIRQIERDYPGNDSKVQRLFDQRAAARQELNSLITKCENILPHLY